VIRAIFTFFFFLCGEKSPENIEERTNAVLRTQRGLGYPAVGAFDKNIREYRYARYSSVFPFLFASAFETNYLLKKQGGRKKADARFLFRNGDT